MQVEAGKLLVEGMAVHWQLLCASIVLELQAGGRVAKRQPAAGQCIFPVLAVHTQSHARLSATTIGT